MILLAVFITHGSIVSLFHRQRAQASTTKHLCVARTRAEARFKTDDSISPEDLESLPDNSFVASSQSWDPFVIYMVDPSKAANPPSGTSTGTRGLLEPMPGLTNANHGAMQTPTIGGHPLPPAPANALPVSFFSATQPILYNCPIVLQCLVTGLISPTMVIRRVEKGTKLFGGFVTVQDETQASETVQSVSQGVTDEPSDSPVLQLHKIALETYQPSVDEGNSTNLNPSGLTTASSSAQRRGPPNASGVFLTCTKERVEVRGLEDERTWRLRPVARGKEMGLATSASGSLSSAMSKSGPIPTAPTVNMGKAARTHRASTAWLNMQTNFTAGSYAGSAGSSAAGSVVDVSVTPSTTLENQIRPPLSRRSTGHLPKDPTDDDLGFSGAVDEQQEASSGPMRNPLRRSSSSWGIQNQLDRLGGKEKRRGQSIGGDSESGASQAHSLLDEVLGEPASRTASTTPGDSAASNAARIRAWALDVAESNVWSIVGAETAEYHYSIPPELVGDVAEAPTMDDEPGRIKTEDQPMDFTRVGSIGSLSESGQGAQLAASHTSLVAPIIHFPRVHTLREVQDEQRVSFIAVYGENLGPHLHAFLGQHAAPTMQCVGTTQMICHLDPQLVSNRPETPLNRLILIRRDGVIFPTNLVL